MHSRTVVALSDSLHAPINEERQGPARAARPPHAAATSWLPRLLHAEDNPTVADAVRETLEERGWEVVSCPASAGRS
jgi:hypothetical protein